MRTFRVFDPEFELFVFDPEDDASLTRCAREFNFHPDDFSYLHWRLGDLIVIEPASSHNIIELRPCRAKPTTFEEIVGSIVSLKDTKVAMLESACVTRQGLHLRLIIDGRLWWVRPRSCFMPIKFFSDDDQEA